jgi:imidazolonepropionase-like amidohydrolase
MPWASGPIEYRALRSAAEPNSLLEGGFTAVRDLGSQTSVVVKRAIDDGVWPGPRMMAAGIAIARTGGPWFGIDPSWRWVRAADGVDECVRAVHTCLREGSSVIKIGSSTGHDGAWGEVPTYSVGEINAITDEAHLWGLRVAAHAMGTPGVRNAVLGGVDTVEHAYNIDDETLGLIIEKGVFVVPTLRLTHANPTPSARNLYGVQIESLRRAYEAGARIALGSDTGEERTPHGSGNAIEFRLMGEVMAPKDALMAGTSVVAQAMGLEADIGSIEPGKYADLVAVAEDPLKDLSALEHVQFIMQGGRVITEP